MRKRNLIIVIATILAVISCYYFGLLPVVSKTGNDVAVKELDLSKGESFNPLNEYDFEEDDYELYYIQSSMDKEGLFSVLYTNDREKLNKLKRLFQCTYSGGDIATLESSLILVKGGKRVLNIAISLEDAPFGVQGERFGWLTFNNKEELTNELKSLDKYFLPWLSL